MHTDFYANNWQVIDFIDTPIYLLYFVIWILKRNKLTIFQTQCNISVFLFLSLKLIDMQFNVDYSIFKFWSLLIIFLPIILLIERNINYDKFK